MATFTRRCVVDWGVTGVSASLFRAVYNGSNTAVVARAAVGGEHPASSGIYYADITWDNAWTSPRVVWDDGTNYAVEGDAIADITQINGAAATAGVSPGGAGSSQCTLHFQDSVGAAIADGDVWITTTTSPTANVVAGTLQTNSSGNVTFLLDTGSTYYKWFEKDGYASVQGVSFVAVAD